MKKLYFYFLIFIFPALSLSAQIDLELEKLLSESVERFSHEAAEQYLTFAYEMEFSEDVTNVGDWVPSEEEKKHLMILEQFYSSKTTAYALDLRQVIEVSLNQVTSDSNYYIIRLKMRPSHSGRVATKEMDGEVNFERFELLEIPLKDDLGIATGIKNAFLNVSRDHGAQVTDGTAL